MVLAIKEHVLVPDAPIIVIGKIDKVNVEECIALLEHYDAAFENPILKPKPQTHEILEHADCKVSLMAQSQILPETNYNSAIPSNPEINMMADKVKSVLHELASYGTGALAWVKTPLWVIMWRFMKNEDVKMPYLRDRDKEFQGNEHTAYIEAAEEMRSPSPIKKFARTRTEDIMSPSGGYEGHGPAGSDTW